MLIGRERELLELRVLFEEGARLVTIIGAAGVGKTSLVQGFLAPDDVFVNLKGSTTCDDVLHRMAQACESAGIGKPSGAPTSEALAEVLKLRPLARVALDNFEQLVPVAADLVEDLLRDAESLQVLVTSRERLQLPQEHVLRLRPLRVPGPDDDTAPALDLLVGRAQRIRRDFALTDKNRAALTELVRRLDGIPLALELAAPRLAMMGPQALLARLDDALSLLGGKSDALRESIEASWRLLDPDEQRALTQCAVFEDGFDLPAADAVLSLESLSPVEAISSLYEKSLLQSDANGRFSMLVSIRSFAREHLEDSSVALRHGRYYAEYGFELRHAVRTAADQAQGRLRR